MAKQKFYAVTSTEKVPRIEVVVRTSKKKKALKIAREKLVVADHIELKVNRIRFEDNEVIFKKETQVLNSSTETL